MARAFSSRVGASWSRASPTTARSKRSGLPTRLALRLVCNGTRSMTRSAIRSTARCLRPSVPQSRRTSAPRSQTKSPAQTPGFPIVESKLASGARPATSHAKLSHLEIFRRFLAAICDDLVLNVLAFVEGAQSGALDGRDVNEHILATALRLDKAIALGRVKPLHSACSHYQSPSLKKNKSSDDRRHTSVSLTSRRGAPYIAQMEAFRYPGSRLRHPGVAATT